MPDFFPSLIGCFAQPVAENPTVVMMEAAFARHGIQARYMRVALDLASLQPGSVVADVIPNPPQTRLLKESAARGCRTLDGLGMLVNQGATNIEYWFGIKPDKTVMRKALEEVFGEK